MFAALFVAIGATAEDIQSVNSFQRVIIMIPFVPLILFGPVFSQPGGIVAQGASIFPLTSPLIMIARLGLSQVPVWEIVLAAGLLILTKIIRC